MLNVSAPQPAASAGVLAARGRATATAGRGFAAFQTATAGQLIISEFRLRGPNGANDEFIEIHNNSGFDHTVMAASGTGYGVAASNGVTRCSIPNGTIIPNRGHYLCVNSVGYSLASSPAGNGTTATGDATYTADIPDNAGIAIFNNNTGGASYSLANRLDAVGSTSEANTLYKEGTGYPALTPFSIDYSFYRKVPGITGGIPGTAVATGKDPQDTDNNAADFLFVDTNGTSAGAGQRLGAPGPQNLFSPLPLGIQQRALLDPCTAATSPPNKVRDFTSNPANNSTFGTVELRRTFTNNTGGNLTRIRFRIQDLTTFPAPSGVADLRPRTSTAVVVTVDRAPCGSGTSNITVQGTTLEQPPSQPNGGGFNSSWSVGTVTLATPLANGASLDVRFLFGIQQTGFYRMAITMEGAPAAGGLWVLCGHTDAGGEGESGCSALPLNLTGTGGDDTLAVTATSADSGSYSLNGGAAVPFSGIPSFAFDGMGGNDTLRINNPSGGLFAPASGINYNGGGQAGDKLEMLGGLASSETYFVGTTTPPIGSGPGNNGSGLIRFTGPNLDLRFTGLAPIVDTVAAASLTVNATDAANTINITNATTAPRLQIAVDAFEPIEFNNKTNVFVNGGDGVAGGDVADTINISSSNVPTALTSVTINANEGNDTVNALAKSGAYSLNINGNADDDTLIGSAGNETFDGGAGNDTFIGNGGTDNIGAGTPNASGDTILVPGTAGGDTITLAISSGNLLVTINGVTTTYGNFLGGAIATSGIDLVSVNADAGADTVNVNSTEASIPTSVNTGLGSDTIAFANGVSLNGGTVDGGADTDTLSYSTFATSVAVNLGLGTTGLGGSMDGIQENPPQTTTAAGTVTISNYNTVTKTFDISVTVTDLAPASVTGYHIHRAPVGTNGPIIIDLSSLFGLGALVPSGTGFTFNATGVTLPAQHEAAFLGGITYFNVHTAAAPGGLIRGQIFSNGNVNLASGTATGTGGVTNVENATGGSGADSLVGSFAVNVLQGNAGNDTIVGGPGNDTMNGGDNNDVLVWSNGDNNDVIDGTLGTDVVQVNGSVTAGDVFTAGANGTRVAFARTNLVPFALDIGTTEQLIVNGVGGDDNTTLNSLAGVADLTEVRLRGFDGNDTFGLMNFPVAPFVVNVHGGPHTTGDTLNVNGGGLVVSDTGTVLTAPSSGTVNYNFIETKAFTNASGLAINSPAAGAEGNAGTTAVTFTVSLSVPSTQTVTVNYATADGTATVADNDYLAATGTLTFNPGETSKPIIVNVNGDVKFEPNETFTVNLSGATNATISTAQGTGTINNDDASNTPPTITAAGALSRQQGSAGVVSNIATVSDTETAASNLVVTSTTVPTGITITSITNTNGTIAANIAADCAATVGANIIALTVTDAGGFTAQANLTVNVAANTPPTLGTYAATTTDLAQTLSVTPSAPPSDSGTISSVIATASAGFTGTVTVVAATGVVTINSAGPAGNHTISITARDNCNAPTTQSFSLQVNNSFEGDVTPRPSGNGVLSVADWVMAGRFAVALETPAIGSEFQRADCAPKATAGDGRITLSDWVQAGRYVVGLDPAVPRGGPTEPLPPSITALLAMQSSLDSAQPREIRVKAANFKRGQANATRLEMSAQGDENALAFTLNFDPTQLSFVTATPPAGQTGATVTMNVTQANQGRIGIALILPSGQTFSAGLQELLDVQFIPAGGATDATTVIGFSDQIVHREAVNAGALSLAQPTFVNGNITITGQAIASVSAASYVGSNGAAGAIFSSFGIGLSTTTVAATPGLPLPTALGGATVRIKDSTGTERMASLFFASPQQINFQIPEDTAVGLASVTITNGNGETSRGLLQIAGIAPGLFTANANGAGVAAANLVRVSTDQSQRYEDVAEYDPAQQRFVARAIEFGSDLGVNSDQLFLLLYGTGIRGRSALDVVSVTVDGMAVPVDYAGKHSQYAGLDQINIRLPRALRGRGEVSIVLQVEGQKANEIKVKFH